ncbi:molybdopterin molybdotransferase MoeA [Streptomyces aureoverticillatus]|uniref:molybdopterin molybdotransferase MoeA n=1 Tax=Streptomyces aureoverticillatus TaxID=66871 RepID=UPI001EF9ADC3|nr:molybdopterin molybdotransferase MoeA [Streptomyces aureoverticillatus]
MNGHHAAEPELDEALALANEDRGGGEHGLGRPGYGEAADVSGAVSAPGAPRTPGAAGTAGASGTPGGSSAPGAPAVSAAPGTPGGFGTAGAPSAPGTAAPSGAHSPRPGAPRQGPAGRANPSGDRQNAPGRRPDVPNANAPGDPATPGTHSFTTPGAHPTPRTSEGPAPAAHTTPWRQARSTARHAGTAAATAAAKAPQALQAPQAPHTPQAPQAPKASQPPKTTARPATTPQTTATPASTAAHPGTTTHATTSTHPSPASHQGTPTHPSPSTHALPPTPLSPTPTPLPQTLGRTLTTPLTALTDLPSFDTSAMDGWAVAGPGPWVLLDGGILAGQDRPGPLGDGEAVRIATGARIPGDTTAVIRSEHGHVDGKGRLHAEREVVPGQDIRPRGQECRAGDQLLPPGALVTPAVLGLAAAAGYDALYVAARPRAEVIVLGDELLTEGLPQEGRIRDALGPMLPPWLRALGAEVTAVRRLGDDAEALYEALATSTADVVVTTGGTASGPVDHVHPTLHRLGAELLVDGVAVRPGHPMLLARLPSGAGERQRHLVGLPGNPLAAVSGLLTLAEPLLRALGSRRPAPEPYTAPLRDDVHGHPYDTRLVPVTLRGEYAVPLHYNGPAMLRGIAAADGLAVVPPRGARKGEELEILDLPWTEPGGAYEMGGVGGMDGSGHPGQPSEPSHPGQPGNPGHHPRQPGGREGELGTGGPTGTGECFT